MRPAVKYIVHAVRLNPGSGDQPGRRTSRFCFPRQGLSFFLQVHHFVTFTDHLRQCRIMVCVIDQFAKGIIDVVGLARGVIVMIETGTQRVQIRLSVTVSPDQGGKLIPAEAACYFTRFKVLM